MGAFVAPPPPHIGDYRQYDSDQYGCSKDGLGNEDAHGIQHDEVAAVRVKAIETAESSRERQQIGFRHLERMLVGVVARSPGIRIAGGVEIDMAAEDIAHRPVLYESAHAPRARGIGLRVIDEQTARHEEVAAEKQGGAP